MKLFANLKIVAFLAAVSCLGNAQPIPPYTSPASSTLSFSVEAKLLVGLRDVPAGTKGTLEVTSANLIFVSSDHMDRIERGRISEVFAGDERAETGGAAGKVARIGIPFGGGAVLGTITQRQVGVLTVDYREAYGGLRSAVFVLGKADALRLAESVRPDLPHPPIEAVSTACNAPRDPGAISLLLVQEVPGLDVAPEYMALLYEGLLEVSAKKIPAARILPDGERDAKCAGYTLKVTVEKFSKGNAAVRASSGPVGLFVGATKLTVRAQLRDSKGRVVLDKEMKGSRRGDRESLTIASAEVDQIAKEIRKAKLQTKQVRL